MRSNVELTLGQKLLPTALGVFVRGRDHEELEAHRTVVSHEPFGERLAPHLGRNRFTCARQLHTQSTDGVRLRLGREGADALA